jgi:Big-like domain-containing protein
MTQRSLTLLVWFCAALAAACGDDNAVGPKSAATEPPPEPVLARLEVTPDSSFLLPLDNQSLTINAWDQFGTRLVPGPGGDWASEATYVSSDSAIARVAGGGVVTGLAPGVATITASLTLADRTVTDSMTVRVGMPIARGTVLKMDYYGRWSPTKVSLKAPATVTWVMPDGVQARTIWLNVWSDKPEKLEFVHGVATRTFSAPGLYYYGTGGGLMWYEEGGIVGVF